MIDTLSLKAQLKDSNYLDVLPLYLSNVGCHSFGDSVVITGELDSLKVVANAYALKIKDRSLCKWYLGDNFQTMTRKDIENAIANLCDALHLDLTGAQVMRLDLAQNYITKHPVSTYFNHLGSLKYAQRLVQPSGLYYHRPNVIACFYDKVKETRNKGESLPEIYTGKNVLRYEFRFMHRLPQVLNVPEVKASMLYDECFYMEIINQWYNTYKHIQKVNDITINFQSMKSKQELYRMGILALVEKIGGEMAIIEQINNAKKIGELTSKQSFDMKKAIKDACKEHTDIVTINDAIVELDKKVNDSIKYYR